MQSTYKNIIIGILISFKILSLYAQETDSLFYMTGQVVSEYNKYPIALAHVINVNQRWGVVADTLGYFDIWVKAGDTLNISAIGFKYLNFGVQENQIDSFVYIKLHPRTYEIPEVSISYLGTYKDFEYKVVNLKLPEININPQFEKVFNYVERAPLVERPSITSPASLIYAMFSKDAKEIDKYLELEEEGKIKDEVYQRYNEHIIRNITGLDREEAFEFMEFCNFQDKYILSIDDYNLYSEIYLRFEAFKKSKEDSTKTD